MGIKKNLASLGLVLWTLTCSSCCLCIVSTLHPSQNRLDQSCFINPHLSWEVTYRGQECVSDLHKTHIPHGTASQLGSGKRSRVLFQQHQVHFSMDQGQMYGAFRCLPLRGLLDSTGLLLLMGHRSPLRASLGFLGLTYESLYFSFSFSCNKVCLFKIQRAWGWGREQGAKIWKLKMLLIPEPLIDKDDRIEATPYS